MVRKIKKVICISIIMICSLLTTGCWDKVEIDRKNFISTIGVDAGKDISNEKDIKKLKPDEPFTDNDLKRFNITYSFPDISKLGPEKGGIAEEKSITTSSYSMEDAIVKATDKSSRNISFAHTKLIILSSDFLNYPEAVKEVMDYFQREASLDRNILMVISEGKAEDFIKYKPNMEKSTQSYILGLIENKASGVIPITLNEFLINLNKNGNSILPWLSYKKDNNELILSGTGVIKNFMLKGRVSSSQTIDTQILRGNLRTGKKVVYKDGHPIDFKIDNIERKIKVDSKSNKIPVTIKLNLEGQIKGYYFDKNLFSKSIVEEIEQGLNKSLKEEMEQVIKTIQDKYDVDLIGVRENIEKYHPRIWDKIENKWDDIYKNMEISVDVNTNIRRMGIIK